MTENKQIIQLCVLISGMTFTISAFVGTVDLQSSIHISHNLGTISLSITYGCSFLLSLFVLPVFLFNLGAKWTLILGEIGFMIFTLANFYSGLATMVPGSILGSMGESFFWAAGVYYVNHLFHEYQDSKPEDQKPQDNVKNVWFGRFYGVVGSCTIWGNLLAYAVLYGAQNFEAKSIHNNTTMAEYDYHTCGSNFCTVTKTNGNYAYVPKSKTSVYILLGVYSALQLFAIILHVVYLPALNKKQDEDFRVLSVGATKETLLSLARYLRSTKQILLAPMSFYYGFLMSYSFSDFTRGFVSCTMGVQQVGLVMAVSGCFSVLGAFMSTKASQKLGLSIVICITVIFDLTNYFIQMLFQPTSNSRYWVYGIAAILGTSVTMALYFPVDTELAFGTITLWQVFAMTIGFILSGRICLSIRIYLLIGNLVLVCIGYAIVEQRRRSTKLKEESEPLIEANGLGNG
ncbi:protein unc-93 homolog A-like [Ciona intestinalis]